MTWYDKCFFAGMVLCAIGGCLVVAGFYGLLIWSRTH